MAIVTTHPIQYQTPLFRHLSEHGIPVHVFFLNDQGSSEQHDTGFGRSFSWDIPLLEGFSYEFLGNIAPRKKADRFFGLINPALAAVLDRRRFSAVLVHGWRSFSMLLALTRANVSRLPVLYRAETTAMSSSVGRNVQLLGWGLRRMVAACLSIGTLNDRFYASLGVPASRRFLTPYTVDNGRFQAAAAALSRDDARRALGLRRPGPVVLFAGKLVPWKNPELLLRAFADAAPEASNLLFVGTGALEDRLRTEGERVAAGRVTFTGFLNQSEMPAAYRAADLLVLPSDHEPWGLVVNEAMNFSVPALITDRVGCGPDLVTCGSNGDIFETGSLRDLSSKLSDLLSAPDDLSEMGVRARQTIETWSYKEAEDGIRAALQAVGAIG